MVKRRAQNAIAVVSIDIGKNRSRYWITMSKRQPEKTSIARRELLAGGVVLAGSAASAALSTAAAGAADDNLPPRVPVWMKEQGAPFLRPARWSAVPIRRASSAGLALRRADEYCGLVDDAMAKTCMGSLHRMVCISSGIMPVPLVDRISIG